jgi:hypothetical protein
MIMGVENPGGILANIASHSFLVESIVSKEVGKVYASLDYFNIYN